MVPRLFVSRARKKQLHVDSVFRKKACEWQTLRMSQFKRRKHFKVCQNLGKRRAKKLRAVVLCSSGTNILHSGETLLKKMCMTISQEWLEIAMLVCANRSQMVDEVTATGGISHGTCNKILSNDLNIFRVTQHSVPFVLMQEQCNNRESNSRHQIDNSDNDGIYLNWVRKGDKTRSFLYDPQMKLQSSIWKFPSMAKKNETMTGLFCSLIT